MSVGSAELFVLAIESSARCAAAEEQIEDRADQREQEHDDDPDEFHPRIPATGHDQIDDVNIQDKDEQGDDGVGRIHREHLTVLMKTLTSMALMSKARARLLLPKSNLLGVMAAAFWVSIGLTKSCEVREQRPGAQQVNHWKRIKHATTRVSGRLGGRGDDSID